jgi:glycosyltransferase involved in cell wall biosynthesis
MPKVDVLIPTFRRKTSLAMLLACLLGQEFTDFDVTVSDQTRDDEQYLESIEIRAVADALRYHGHRVTLLRHLPRRGLAEQRQFLLEQAAAPYVQYLDDDLLLEPGVIGRMVRVIEQDQCGFVGCPAAGLGFLDDVRPHQQCIELWETPVVPEPMQPETIPWDRHVINSAANPLHLADRLVPSGDVLRYRVAWVGGNLLYDREKLLDVGGFSFWDRLPDEHAGEEVVAQLLLLNRYGGCGILPAGTYHVGLPTTVPNREVNATSLYATLLAEDEARHRTASRDAGSAG